jgi:NitT/TauT family transport system substrate-binding protein
MQDPTKAEPAIDSVRRRVLLGAAGAAALAMCPPVAAASADKIRIGYWGTPGALPFEVALEKGYFEEAGLVIEALKYITGAQLVERLRSGRIDGSAGGTQSMDLAGRELKAAGSFKLIALDGSDPAHALDELLVGKDSPLKSISELKGKSVGSWPERQNLALCTAILEKNGVTDAPISAFPVTQHVAVIDQKSVDAVFTFEPTGTIGRLKGMTRVLESNVVAKYVLGDAAATWWSGGASLSSEFAAKYPEDTKKYIDAYRRGVELVRKEPAAARKLLKNYTLLDAEVIDAMPLPAFAMYDDVDASKVAMLQKYFDFLTARSMLEGKVTAASMMFRS